MPRFPDPVERRAAQGWFIQVVAVCAGSVSFDEAMGMDELTRRAFLLARSRLYPAPPDVSA